jgi:hypothetical protein
MFHICSVNGEMAKTLPIFGLNRKILNNLSNLSSGTGIGIKSFKIPLKIFFSTPEVPLNIAAYVAI